VIAPAAPEASVSSTRRIGSSGPLDSNPPVSALVPGDVVAWRRPPGSHNPNTGHVMIVEEPPTRRHGTEWIVPIIDSSNGHGGSDPRHEPDKTGLGRGSVVLVTDEAAHPTAFRWKTSSSALVHATTVVLGRVA
jgi:hypothetical protein